jgi:glycosyltransferase involved in cell wall biosynthesis
VPIFVSIANLRPVKSHSTLVSAANLLLKKLPDALYLILGEGPVVQEQLTKQIDELKLHGCVRLMGAQPDVRPWLAAANIGIITSLSEGSSNSLLEYMAAGLPTVVSEIPANRELAQAVYFAPGNPSDLAEKMYSLWEDVDLQNQIRDRHLEIAKTHGRTELGHRLREFYARLASAMS